MTDTLHEVLTREGYTLFGSTEPGEIDGMLGIREAIHHGTRTSFVVVPRYLVADAAKEKGLDEPYILYERFPERSNLSEKAKKLLNRA
jgi:hypothetical protein